MRSYEDCIKERFSAYGEDVPEAALGEGSIMRRFLEAANRAEVESAQETVRAIKTEAEGPAMVRLIKERRGDASDIVVNVLAQGTSGVLGAGLAQLTKNSNLAMVPGLLMIATGFLARQPYPVRQGLVSSGLSWVAGAKVTK